MTWFDCFVLYDPMVAAAKYFAAIKNNILPDIDCILKRKTQTMEQVSLTVRIMYNKYACIQFVTLLRRYDTQFGCYIRHHLRRVSFAHILRSSEIYCYCMKIPENR